jgi:hypothetical protein
VNVTATRGGSASAMAAEKISLNVKDGHDQPGIRLSSFVLFVEMPGIENRQPDAEDDQTAGGWNEMGRVEDVEDAAGKGEHRESSDAARTFRLIGGKKILEGEA